MHLHFFIVLAIAQCVVAQQIYDVWTTTWDRSSYFTYTNLSPNPINFGTPGTTGAADIIVDDSSVYQSVVGFGGSLTDSSAQLLSNLKSQNAANYWSLLGYTFTPGDGQNASGLSYIRVPLGASDFSQNLYSYDDTNGDTSFNNFNINVAPSYVFDVINDIQSINSILKVHILPWSPPGWMKTTGTMDGGSLSSQYVSVYANYLLKCVQGFASHGITPYAIGIQNEPQNSNPTYPTALVSVDQEAQIGNALRTLLNNNGYSSVKIIGYEHNWDTAGSYPVQLMQEAGDAFDGVAFHCYAGSVSEQADFYNAFPSKEVYFTECSGTIGSDWWSDIKWYMDNIFIGAVSYNAMNAMMWNFALDGSGQPMLSSSNSCGGGCRGMVQINSDGSWSVNQEWLSAAQASKAVLPKDSGGPWGQRIGVSVQGSMSWGLVVGAYVTGRVSSSDWDRYSLVVLNWADNTNGNWNPQEITATIEFRGAQASYTFPVGVTTLWWYAPPNSFRSRKSPNATEPSHPHKPKPSSHQHPLETPNHHADGHKHGYKYEAGEDEGQDQFVAKVYSQSKRSERPTIPEYLKFIKQPANFTESHE